MRYSVGMGYYTLVKGSRSPGVKGSRVYKNKNIISIIRQFTWPLEPLPPWTLILFYLLALSTDYAIFLYAQINTGPETKP